MNDERYVYSATCSWHGSIKEVGRTVPRNGISLPCCPHCGGVLFEVHNKELWDEGARKYEAAGHTHYVEFLEWTRTKSRCWKSLRDAGIDFTKETGKKVICDL